MTPPGTGPAPARALVVADLLHRARIRLDATDDDALLRLCEDAHHHERRRAERGDEEAAHHADTLARAVVGGRRADLQGAALARLAVWTEQIHGRFDPRVYQLATRVAPGLIDRALTSGVRGRAQAGGASRRIVRGDTDLLARLAQEATLLLVPTHVSNLDSPLIGLALHQAGLPPFLYGAGLNLFSNAWLGWWMRRLGAYTVDRTNKAALYLDLLKDYSTRALAHGHHSLFFPGGTRARSGAYETHLKRGLLGTALPAWQETLSRGVNREIYVVPATFSYGLVLEADTLIRDHLSEEGRARYIITDDELAAARTVWTYLRRVVDLDTTVTVHFGAPLDLVGRPVPADPRERAEAAAVRRRLVTDREGRVERNPQRDRVYTDALAQALVTAWPRYGTLTPTAAAAWASWRVLVETTGSSDPYRILRRPDAPLPKARVLDHLQQGLSTARRRASEGLGRVDLPEAPETVLAAALDAFGRWHEKRALTDAGDRLLASEARLLWYYSRRAEPVMDAAAPVAP